METLFSNLSPDHLDPSQQLLWVGLPVAFSALLYGAGKKLLNSSLGRKRKREEQQDSTCSEEPRLFPQVPIPLESDKNLMEKVEDLQQDLQSLRTMVEKTFLTSEKESPLARGQMITSLNSSEDTQDSKRIRLQRNPTIEYRICNWTPKEVKELASMIQECQFSASNFNPPMQELRFSGYGASVLVCADPISALAFAMIHFPRVLIAHAVSDLHHLCTKGENSHDGVIFFDFSARCCNTLEAVEWLVQTNRNVTIKSKCGTKDITLPKNLPRVFIGANPHEAIGFRYPSETATRALMRCKILDMGRNPLWKNPSDAQWVRTLLKRVIQQQSETTENLITLESSDSKQEIASIRNSTVFDNNNAKPTQRQTTLDEWVRVHPNNSTGKRPFLTPVLDLTHLAEDLKKSSGNHENT